MTILNKSPRYEVTSRDRALLTPLLYGPLTAAQLQRFNWQMERPFLSEKYLRRRLCRLSTLGLVHSDRRYAAEIENGPKVYQLTKAGTMFLENWIGILDAHRQMLESFASITMPPSADDTHDVDEEDEEK